MALLERLNAFARQHDLLPENTAVLVAISGGVDSVVLVHLLLQRGQPLALAHANFQLRGAESDEDERFVHALAEEWKVPLYVKRFDTRAYAEEHGRSVQVAARQLRYSWFEQLCKEHGWERLATGHNLNDSVETALFHWARGTGLSGMAGIPLRNGRIVRPLLFATRAEITAYAHSQGLAWREDSSNADLKYTRNALRNKVLPELEGLFPDFIRQAGNTLNRLRAADANAQHLLRQLLEPSSQEGVLSLSIERITALPAPVDALFDLLQPYGFTPEQTQQMMRGREAVGTEWCSEAGYRIVVGRGQWLLTRQAAAQEALRIHADDLMVRLPDGSRFFITPAAPENRDADDPFSAVVDAELLRFPLLLRRWRPGDVFQPLGMGGKHQKLQDFFTNQKLSVLEKERIWLLENGDERIIWVVGMRLAEPFKATNKTFKLLKFSWIKR